MKNKDRKYNLGRSISRLILFSIAFHLVYILSIFDIYFKSPVIHGIDPVSPPSLFDSQIDQPKRLVLIVGDGLRADKTFEINENTGKTNAPFLRRIIMENGKKKKKKI